MSSAADRSITQLIAIAALAIALLGNLAVFAYAKISDHEARMERQARITQVDTFLRLQCQRDATRDGVIIQALEQAQARARASISDPRMQKVQIQALQQEINKIASFQRTCIRELPANK